MFLIAFASTIDQGHAPELSVYDMEPADIQSPTQASLRDKQRTPPPPIDVSTTRAMPSAGGRPQGKRKMTDVEEEESDAPKRLRSGGSRQPGVNRSTLQQVRERNAVKKDIHSAVRKLGNA